MFGLQVRAGQTDSVNFESTSAEVTIRGFVAHLSIKLVYKNVSSTTHEVSYVFPVDAKAAVYNFEARLEGRTIIGKCLEKKKAQEAYKEAVKQGHTAILGSEDNLAGDIIHLSLGNLPKGETAEIGIKMVMELPVGVDGGVTFTLPTIFNPRYCPADQKSGPSFHPSSSHSDVIKSLAQYSLEVKGEVRGSWKITRVTSETDPVTVKICDDGTTADITQDGGSTLDHDWSFKVYYQTVHRPQVLQMTGDRSNTGIMKDDVLMVNLFPEIPVESFSPHNEIIFVVDRSGSMEGSKIVQAKAALFLFVKSLPHGCRFNVVSFGHSYSSLFESSSERYTEETLDQALKLQKSMWADMGGTEIMAPLRHVYSKDLIPGYARQMIVLTDGQVWNQREIFDLVARHATETRVFAVGIGDGASTALIQGIAEAGRARFEMVVNETQLQIKVMGMVASMLQDNVRDLKVDIEAELSQAISLVPKLPPVVFGGQHLILYARISPKTKINSLKISGKVGDRELKEEIKECQIVHDSNFSFHRLAAKAQLRQWELERAEEMQEKMIELSVPSNVVCKATAFVGIDQDQRTIQEVDEESSDSSTHSGEFLQSAGTSPAGVRFQMGSIPSTGGCFTMYSESVPHMKSKHRVKISGGGRTDERRNLCCAADSSEESEAENEIHGKTMMVDFEDMFKTQRRKLCYAAHSSEESEAEDEIHEFSCSSSSDLFKHPGEEMSKMAEPEDELLRIVSWQRFDGSWDLLSCFQNAIVVPDNFIKRVQSELSVDESCFATSVILAYLEVRFASRKPEWLLVHVKGKMFLQSKGVDATPIIDKISRELKSALQEDQS